MRIEMNKVLSLNYNYDEEWIAASIAERKMQQ